MKRMKRIKVAKMGTPKKYKKKEWIVVSLSAETKVQKTQKKQKTTKHVTSMSVHYWYLITLPAKLRADIWQWKQLQS